MRDIVRKRVFLLVCFRVEFLGKCLTDCIENIKQDKDLGEKRSMCY